MGTDSRESSAVETSDDGRHIVVNGRRRRASDPSIPPKLRQELVDELMAARRAVKSGDSDARRRVDDAKVALGERGHPWWEAPDPGELDRRIEAALRALVRKRSETSACPSDIARIVGGSAGAWRGLMDDVRRVTADLARRGDVVVTQKGVSVEVETARGPLRISRGPAL